MQFWWCDSVLLQPADGAQRVVNKYKVVADFGAQWIAVWQNFENFRQQFISSQLVNLLQQLAAVKIVRILVNNVGAKAMEGMDGYMVGWPANDFHQPLAHIAGSVVGK